MYFFFSLTPVPVDHACAPTDDASPPGPTNGDGCVFDDVHDIPGTNSLAVADSLKAIVVWTYSGRFLIAILHVVASVYAEKQNTQMGYFCRSLYFEDIRP